MRKKNKLIFTGAFINGKEVTSEKTFEVINPATGKTITKVADLDIDDCEKAILAAADALPTWSTASPEERSNVLRKWFYTVMEHEDSLAEIMTLESGKPLAESKTEVAYAASFISWFADEALRTYGDHIPAPKEKQIITIKQAVGVTAAITPWNFPMAMITRKVAPALAAGCTVVLRPAAETPLTAIAIAQLGANAGIPSGVFNVITSTDASGIGASLSKSETVRKISFTGSTKVGKILMEQAASTIKKVSFELGGNAPFLVFNDADVDAAVEGAIAAKYRNSGQTCVSVNRFLVQDDVYESFSKKLTEAISKLEVGNGLDANVKVGPLINQDGLDKVIEHVEDAVKKGAHLKTGGKVLGGLFFEPTVLTEVPLDAKLAKEETFGPVSALFRFKTEEEGIKMANDTEFGLAAYFYSENVRRCWRVAKALESGMIGINEGAISAASAPFGGVKESGLGREGSKYGIEEFMETKYLCFGVG